MGFVVSFCFSLLVGNVMTLFARRKPFFLCNTIKWQYWDNAFSKNRSLKIKPQLPFSSDYSYSIINKPLVSVWNLTSFFFCVRVKSSIFVTFALQWYSGCSCSRWLLVNSSLKADEAMQTWGQFGFSFDYNAWKYSSSSFAAKPILLCLLLLEVSCVLEGNFCSL